MLPDLDDYPAPDDFDHQVFALTVPPDHYLRQVLQVVDFPRCRELFTEVYSATLGRPAREPVLLLKLAFLQFQYNLSDREVLRAAQVNMAFRCFLDLSLRSPLPDPSLLSKFRQRLGPDKHRQLFEELVAQARAHGLVKDRLRLKDATHLIANIAIPSAVELVAQTRQQLLDALRPYAPDRVVEDEQHAAAIRTATVDLPGSERLAQRVEHLRSIVTWLEGSLLPTLGPAPVGDPLREALTTALQLAHKVLADRETPKAKDKLVSLEDRDARWGKHGVSYAGFLLDVAMDADSSLITSLNVLPANGDEAADATTLIEQEEQAHGNDVQALSLDGVGFRGSLLQEWTDPQGLALEVIVPPKAETASAYFTAADFTLDADGETLTCPAGATTTHKESTTRETGWTFRFTRSTCQGCPLREKCLEKMPKSKGRAVFKSAYAAEYAAARAKAQTPAFAAARRQHWRIERKLGEMVRWHGARRARYRGLGKVLVQGLLTAVVVNVKRMVKLLLGTAPVRADLAVLS